MSMSLYNELRPPILSLDLMANYTWDFWYKQMTRGSRAINSANPQLLVFLSGLHGDADLQPVVEGTALDPGKSTFSRLDFAGFDDKLVLELHSYDIVSSVTDCSLYNSNLFKAGYSAVTDKAANRFPVVMSEWGFAQDGTTWLSGTYAKCVQSFLKDAVPGQGWFVWTISGSYYIRQGKQDYDETWGLLNHNWSDWRSPEFIESGLKPLVSSTISSAVGGGGFNLKEGTEWEHAMRTEDVDFYDRLA
ncbi:unnamed protein product [Discula destructiva]